MKRYSIIPCTSADCLSHFKVHAAASDSLNKWILALLLPLCVDEIDGIAVHGARLVESMQHRMDIPAVLDDVGLLLKI